MVGVASFAITRMEATSVNVTAATNLWLIKRIAKVSRHNIPVMKQLWVE